jgi:acyl-CoA thioesterase FadM
LHSASLKGTEDMWHSEFRLRLGEIDGLGHLTATAYLGLFEETRAAWIMSTLGVAYPSYVLASQQIDYLHEVRLADGPVHVSLTVQDLSNSSLHVVEHLTTGTTLHARSTATLVTWDMEQRCSRPISRAERELFEQFREATTSEQQHVPSPRRAVGTP